MGWLDKLPDANFGGKDGAFTLFKDRVEYRKGLSNNSVPLSQVESIDLEDGEDLQSRVTVTRLVAVGIFAFALKKKRGGEKYLSITSGNSVWVVEVGRKDVGKAVKFRAAVESARRTAAPENA